jgi:hypothetical protein
MKAEGQGHQFVVYPVSIAATARWFDVKYD